MSYTPEQGRIFWLAFDNRFKFEAFTNGLWARYESWGGYSNCYAVWKAAQASSTPADFAAYAQQNRENLLFVADEQEAVFTSHFGTDAEAIVSAFRDFAFGVLASPTAPNRGTEPVHTMNGGLFAADYASWHGYIECVLMIRPDSEFWKRLRWVNGMAWELQVKARPQEIFPNQNAPLDAAITNAIRAKWEARTVEEVAGEFVRYDEMPFEWLS